MDGSESDGLDFLSVTELRGEVKRLAGVVATNEDCPSDVYDRILAAVLKLKAIDSLPSDDSSRPKSLDCLSVPECFLCPISSELMTDPVIVATGQTYDRPYIQTWFDADHKTCPKTQQLLPHLTLTPNYLVRSMIEQWCEVHGVEYPSRAAPMGIGDSAPGIMPHEVKYLNMLLDKLSSKFMSQHRQAARELRILTKKKQSHRVFLGGEPRALGLLISLLGSTDAETQEHGVTALFNLSIYEPNKKQIAVEKGIEPIVEVLRRGHTKTARENAAATLFSMSNLDENKALIGNVEGAVAALVNLMDEAGSKDAASALFNLCIRQENRAAAVKAGSVTVLKRLVKEGMRDESLAILALLSSNYQASAEMSEDAKDWLDVLVSDVIKDPSASSHAKENAVAVVAVMCSRDPEMVQMIRSNSYLQPIVALSVVGSSSSRARRKATLLVKLINRQNRNATF